MKTAFFGASFQKQGPVAPKFPGRDLQGLGSGGKAEGWSMVLSPLTMIFVVVEIADLVVEEVARIGK